MPNTGQNQNYGVIFDWDGVIIDSHDAHEDSWDRLSDEMGKALPEGFFKATFGMRNDCIIPKYFDWVDENDHATISRLGERKEEHYRDILREKGISPLPGVREFLAELIAAEVPFAVGSSTTIKNILTIIEVADLGVFTAISSAEDVKVGKPNPEVFLVAANKIDRAPDRCVVFEDAQVGLDAAKAGGMKAVALTTTNPAERLSGQDLTIADLSEASWSTLRSKLWDS